MALDNNALITLANLKSFFKIIESTYDDQLEKWINSASTDIQKRMGRELVYATRTNIGLDGPGTSMLFMPHWPIISVSSLKENDESLTEDTDFIIYPDEGYLLKIAADITAGYPTDVWAEGNRNIIISYTSGYKLIDIVYFDSGSEEPKIGDTLVGATSEAEGVVSKVVLTTGIWGSGTAEGWIEFSSVTGTFQNNENVNIDGGTSNVLTVDHPDNTLWIPKDIQSACAIQAVIDWHKALGEDWEVVSKAFGDGSTTRNVDDLQKRVEAIIKNYWRHTL